MSADDVLIRALVDAFGDGVFDASSIRGQTPLNPPLATAITWFMRVRVGQHRRLGKRSEAGVRRWLQRHANRGVTGDGLWLDRDEAGWFRVRELSATEGNWVCGVEGGAR